MKKRHGSGPRSDSRPKRGDPRSESPFDDLGADRFNWIEGNLENDDEEDEWSEADDDFESSARGSWNEDDWDDDDDDDSQSARRWRREA